MKKNPATPEQIARFGHIAVALRSFLDQKGWGPSNLNSAMGKARGNTGIYAILSGKAAPGSVMRAKLSKATGIPEEQFFPKELDDLVPVRTAKRSYIRGDVTKTDVLSFVVSNDGNVRIQLDATLPVESAMPLLQMLLDAGLVFKAAE